LTPLASTQSASPCFQNSPTWILQAQVSTSGADDVAVESLAQALQALV
jgi:hypothetical protein